MGEACCFDHLGIEASKGCFFLLFFSEPLSQATAYLRDFYRVLLPGVEDIRFAGPDDLRNTSEAVEGRRVQKPVTIAFELRTLIFRGIFIPAKLSIADRPSAQAATTCAAT
jgi:hypothetical protein